MITGITEMWSLQRCVRKKKKNKILSLIKQLQICESFTLTDVLSDHAASRRRAAHRIPWPPPGSRRDGAGVCLLVLSCRSFTVHLIAYTVRRCGVIAVAVVSDIIMHHRRRLRAARWRPNNNNSTELNHLLCHGTLKKTEFKVFCSCKTAVLFGPTVPAAQRSLLEVLVQSERPLGANRGIASPTLVNPSLAVSESFETRIDHRNYKKITRSLTVMKYYLSSTNVISVAKRDDKQTSSRYKTLLKPNKEQINHRYNFKRL